MGSQGVGMSDDCGVHCGEDMPGVTIHCRKKCCHERGSSSVDIEEVSEFKKDDRFSDYWDVAIRNPGTIWGIDPRDDTIHEIKHEADAQECAESVPDIIVFWADLVVPGSE